MKAHAEFAIHPLASRALQHTVQFSSFDHLVKSQIHEQKIKTKLNSGMERKDLLLKKYRLSVLHRTLFTLACPIFVWLVLETFFK